ncbi:2Fe-2S iron-sulfur cluster-binding protein [Candidatus Eisenbacteria bacterium]|uniref:2Fe-2S iron-sulfur cluster-binding protein n=1 Tax=Eiseniibacteriota bacterium TaxID=2212470 RepID=A0ABV6YIZ5_UNCEI
MSSEMIRLSIDGRPIEVPAETTILQAAEKLGIFIPRYCYHPGLDIVGSCRMCQVEIKGNPKPAISCHVRVQPDQEVFTDSPLVRRSRRAVLEFLLLNHPIDCPICDASGECDLQDFYMTDGRHKSRLRLPKLNRKKATRLGPTIVLDQERCILCSRCVRFLRDITRTHELGFFGRGSTSYVDVVDGGSIEGNPYAGNIVDICPVGALTDESFRFKCRAWYLSEAPSICPHCATGCNTSVQFNTELCWKNDGKRIMRIMPRFNPQVNDYWMCDIGRHNHDWAEEQTRIKRPLRLSSGAAEEITWEEALSFAIPNLTGLPDREGGKPIAALPSLWMTNESAYLFRRLFLEGLGACATSLPMGESESGDDGLLLHDDRNPNRLGLKVIGCTDHAGDSPRDEILRQASEGKFAALVFVQDRVDRLPPVELIEAATRGAAFVMVLASNTSPFTERAKLVLPISPWTEDDGTWVNWRGLVQRLTPALPPVGYSRNTAQVLAMLGTRLGVELGDGKPEETFARLAQAVPEFEGLSYDTLGEFGAPLKGHCGSKGCRVGCEALGRFDLAGNSGR